MNSAGALVLVIAMYTCTIPQTSKRFTSDLQLRRVITSLTLLCRRRLTRAICADRMDSCALSTQPGWPESDFNVRLQAAHARAKLLATMPK